MTELAAPVEPIPTQLGANIFELEHHKLRGDLRRDLRSILLGEASKLLNVDIIEGEVEVAVKMLRKNKAGGLDNLQADSVIEGRQILLEPLALLFNKIFKTTFPESWEIGVITPIYKKGDALDCGNYRGGDGFIDTRRAICVCAENKTDYMGRKVGM
jgi:hypothetical protein